MCICFLANLHIELCLVKSPSMPAAALLYSGIKLFLFSFVDNGEVKPYWSSYNFIKWNSSGTWETGWKVDTLRKSTELTTCCLIFWQNSKNKLKIWEILPYKILMIFKISCLDKNVKSFSKVLICKNQLFLHTWP